MNPVVETVEVKQIQENKGYTVQQPEVNPDEVVVELVEQIRNSKGFTQGEMAEYLKDLELESANRIRCPS